jgi:hypothetical protein
MAKQLPNPVVQCNNRLQDPLAQLASEFGAVVVTCSLATLAGSALARMLRDGRMTRQEARRQIQLLTSLALAPDPPPTKSMPTISEREVA